MEHEFAHLVAEFERGKITRRQLIRSLALTATAASAASATTPASAAESPLKAIAVNHISYQVVDYGKTRDFYANLLGMKVSDDDGRTARLTFGSDETCLVPRTARAGSPTPRIDHIAYTLEHWDKDAVKAELDRRGFTSRLDNNSFHVADPDGFDVQIGARSDKAPGVS
ncbi:MAG TPA: VOC family protein [Vicinamibacterales bacterium]|jgi:catechol-2,3-dioxygenase